jgi:hypothetical protein
MLGPVEITNIGSEIFISDSLNNRIKVFSVRGSFLRAFGGFGSGNGQFNEPFQIAALGQELYVADRANNRVQVFSVSGQYQRQWGSLGSGDGEFILPRGIAVLGSEIYVVDDSTPRRIQVFNTLGVFQRKWTTNTANSIHGGNSEIYSPDTLNPAIADIEVYNAAGILQRTIGTPGSGPGEFRNIFGITSDATSLYIVDSNTERRIQVFTIAGVFRYLWGQSGTGDGEFVNPWGIHFFDNEVYVIDTSTSRVQVFDTSGVFQRKWGTQGVLEGIPSTEFFAYQNGAAPESLGAPDGGVAVPALQALAKAPASGAAFADGADFLPENDYIQMRAAIEALAPFYENSVTGNPFNWTNGSADNLYFVAMGDRTKYGATGGAKYDWTHDLATLRGQVPYDIDIGEIEECIAKLEASDLV